MPSANESSELPQLLRQLEQNIHSNSHANSAKLLTRTKITLLHQNALVPALSTPSSLLAAAQHALELGALISIRLQDPAAFTRYFQQLQPFYSVPPSQQSAQQLERSERSKITGLYLLLLLSQGDYAGFHTVLEGLEVAAAQQQHQRGASGKSGLEEDDFVQYPIRLEQWLMEGSYDRVWEETKSERVPSEEFAIFSGILVGTIRDEVASCSEKTYGSIPVANAKNLLFLESEGSVVQFAQSRGWQAKDGRIHFPTVDSGSSEDDILATSGQVIQNALGYARELETIV